MIKEVVCLKLLYECSQSNQDMVLESRLQFAPQTPKDSQQLERAILVKFKAAENSDQFRLECECRVVFGFEKKEDVLENRVLLQMYQRDAYEALQDLINKSLAAVGQNQFDFPDLDFE